MSDDNAFGIGLFAFVVLFFAGLFTLATASDTNEWTPIDTGGRCYVHHVEDVRVWFEGGGDRSNTRVTYCREAVK